MKAIRALELIAVSMPEIQTKDIIIVEGLPKTMSRDVGISLTHRAGSGSLGLYPGGVVRRHFTSHNRSISVERTKSVVGDAGESIGDYDFFFEWVQEPTMEQVYDLIERIDVVLAPLGCWYRITTTST